MGKSTEAHDGRLHEAVHVSPLFTARLFVIVPFFLVYTMIYSGPLHSVGTLFADPDLWWHLANARILMATGHFIRIEPYAWSVAGSPWINPEWLSELPYWFAYKGFKLEGIFLVSWLALAANLLLVFWRARRQSSQGSVVFWSSILAFSMMNVSAGPRTILFGYLLMNIELLIFECSDAGHESLLWFLPPLFCLWVNTHGTWLIGVALFGVYALSKTITVNSRFVEQKASPKAIRIRMLCVLLASAAALFINPYGVRILASPLDMIFHQPLNIEMTREWDPLRISSFYGLLLLAFVLLLVAANLRAPRKWNLFEIFQVLFALYAALSHVRFVCMAAVLMIPLLARDLNRAFPGKTPRRPRTALSVAAGLALAIVGLLMIPSNEICQENLELAYPERLIALLNPQWKLFNEIRVGGRLAFEGKPDFIDSRNDTFEHHGQLQDYTSASRSGQSIDVIDRNGIDHALLSEHSAIAIALMSRAWIVLEKEQCTGRTYVLLARPTH